MKTFSFLQTFDFQIQEKGSGGTREAKFLM
jgi:hypothetical protein